MTEAAGLTLIKTQVQAVTGFDANNTTIGKWGILNSGKNDHYAIIKPGETTRENYSLSAVGTLYTTIIEVWQRYKDDGETLTDLLAHIENITARIDQYRKLADTTSTIRDANIVGYGDVNEQWNKDGGVSWLSRDIVIEWTEEEPITYAE